MCVWFHVLCAWSIQCKVTSSRKFLIASQLCHRARLDVHLYANLEAAERGEGSWHQTTWRAEILTERWPTERERERHDMIHHYFGCAQTEHLKAFWSCSGSLSCRKVLNVKMKMLNVTWMEIKQEKETCQVGSRGCSVQGRKELLFFCCLVVLLQVIWSSGHLVIYLMIVRTGVVDYRWTKQLHTWAYVYACIYSIMIWIFPVPNNMFHP